VIEVEVHQHLRALLREQGGDSWPHHLTVARLVARALRLQRSTLIQVSNTAAYQGQHRLSYLAALLLWSEPVVVVAPPGVQQLLCHVELPRLRDWLQVTKPLYVAEANLDPEFPGITFISPQQWLQQQLHDPTSWPSKLPVVIDGAEHLDTWVRSCLTQTLNPQDWDALLWFHPTLGDHIRNIRAALTYALFQHPPNPYGCVMVDDPERLLLGQLFETLHSQTNGKQPETWLPFATQVSRANTLLWADLDRGQGTFTLHSAPLEISPILQPLWAHRTTILLSGVLDLDAQAEIFRQQVGLGELTCVQFATDRHNDALTLYLPDGMPMPNTPEFTPALLSQLYQLLRYSAASFSVLIIDDSPLKSLIAAQLAAEFGSRVKVERAATLMGTILVTGWTFWQQHQRSLPHPHLLVMATLPFPSLENPKVAGRVAYYKQQRQDWFRLYLLPEALKTLQQVIAPLRLEPSLLALFDNRVLHRSYGQQVLSVLSPYARLNYLDESTLMPPQCAVTSSDSEY
jgi:ATP-dependent DNA helicase DinG